MQGPSSQHKETVSTNCLLMLTTVTPDPGCDYFELDTTLLLVFLHSDMEINCSDTSVFDLCAGNARPREARIEIFFYNLFTVPRTLTYKWLERNQAQHIGRLSRATCVSLSTKGQSLAIQFDRVESAFILALFHWLKPLIDEGGEDIGVPGENPWRRVSEKATY